MSDVAAEVMAIIASKIRGRQSHIQVSDKLDDLGLESLDTVEAIFDLEEKFDIEIPFSPNDVRARFGTVEDVVRAVQSLVDGRA